MSMVKEKDSDLKMWTIASGEKNLKSILFSENEREIELKQETVTVHNKMNVIFCVTMTNVKAFEKILDKLKRWIKNVCYCCHHGNQQSHPYLCTTLL